jgi:hypothetical protein
MVSFSFDADIWEADEVQEAVDLAKATILEGKTVIEFTSLSTTARFQTPVSPQEILDAARRYWKVIDRDTGLRIRKGSKTAHIAFV